VGSTKYFVYGVLSLLVCLSGSMAHSSLSVYAATFSNSIQGSSISGTVLDESVPPKSIAGASISLTNLVTAQIRSDRSDSAGYFSFANLRPGEYLVKVSRPGFVTATYGARHYRQPGRAIVVGHDQQVGALTLFLSRGGIIAGTIRDDKGNPARGIHVELRKVNWLNGERLLGSGRNAVDVGGTVTSITDEFGNYRLYNLPPGEYCVAAASSSALTGQLWAVYYPGVSDPSNAGTVSIAGSEQRSVDINLGAEALATIRGAIFPTLDPLTIYVDRFPADPFSAPRRASADGTFEIAGVPFGRYRLFAYSVGIAPMWGEAFVSVSSVSPPSNSVLLQPARSIHGRVRMDGRSERRLDVAIPLAMLPESPERLRFTPQLSWLQGGEFVATGVFPGTYRFVLNPSTTHSDSGLLIKDVHIGDKDYLDLPFEIGPSAGAEDITIELTATRQHILGDLTSESSLSDDDLMIVVFPDEARYWGKSPLRTRAVQPNTAGHFSISDLPAGNYRIALVRALSVDELSRPDVIRSLVPTSGGLALNAGESRQCQIAETSQQSTIRCN